MGTLRGAAGSVAGAAGVAGGTEGTIRSGAVTVTVFTEDVGGETSGAVGAGVRMSHRC
jgi:hypothetical protein